ncbi:MAG: DUF378 domain-containing protein [Microgenomates group bacterium]
MEHKPLHTATYLLVIVGALNWGLVGLFDVNLVASLLGAGSMSEKVVYILVGLSAVIDLMMHMGYCKMCSNSKK